jgi:two-component system, cell cycle sensor histidine kinase and response regulator CckA
MYIDPARSTPQTTACSLPAENLMLGSENRLSILDLITDAVSVWTLGGRVISLNLAAEKIYGWGSGDAIGRQVQELEYNLDRQLYQTALAATLCNGEWSGQIEPIDREGKLLTVASRWFLMPDNCGVAQSIMAIDTDLTEQKCLERQFLRAQRLENLGTLASGIAHDLNNILTPIVAISDLLPLKLPEIDDRTRQLIKLLSDNSRRGADLVAQILSFARGSKGEHTEIQLRHLLSEIVQVVRHTFPKSIESSLQIATTDLWLVSANGTQLQQVLMNLCVNARDAMPDGGQLTILAENIILDEISCRIHPHARVGAYVTIAVADTGIGIPPDLLAEIFKPFFTTKVAGKGTGLGLSTVLTIVRNHGGFVNVSSQPDKGTLFRVYLPASTQAIELPPTNPILARAGNGELVLIVDDEPSIREIISTTLEDNAYETLLASDAAEAIELCRAHIDRIGAILFDYMMPASNPTDAIASIRSLSAGVPIVIMSGLSVQEIESQPYSGQINSFLPKPFNTQELLHILNSVIADHN